MLIPLVAVVMGTLMFLIPIAGFTARFALKPIVEALARYREVQGGATGRELNVLEQRVALLEQQYQSLESNVHRISELKEFDRQLSAGPGEGV
ncbi:MAG: hypothetical protein ACT443_10365 [Gemmatimonadota bacterium]